VAIELLAPGRLSMTNDCPSRSESHWPSKRALMSADWPGGKPILNFTVAGFELLEHLVVD